MADQSERRSPKGRAVSRRAWIAVVLAGVSVNAALAASACSSDSPASDGADGGGEGGSDAGKDVATPKTDGSSGDGGNCSPVKGPCDLVLQDCPADNTGAKQECVVGGSPDAGFTTQCVPLQTSQQLPAGYACCPPTANAPDNACLPGLSCIGSPCVDGGPQTGRCAPACCKGDDQSCGKSSPEGIAGSCDLTVYSGDTPLYDTCSYKERCKPFGVEPCKAGKACLIEDKVGSASCLGDNGKQIGEGCGFANDCADGLFCLNLGDGGVCRMMCVTPDSIPPFDASVEGGPGAGGCPTALCPDNKSCCQIGPFLNDLPPWLSFCAFADGG